MKCLLFGLKIIPSLLFDNQQPHQLNDEGIVIWWLHFDIKNKIAAKCAKIIQENGVILRALPGDIIGFCPPLIIKEEQINEMFDKVEKVLASIDFERL